MEGGAVFSAVQPGFEGALEEDVQRRFAGAVIVESLPGWRIFQLPEAVALTELREPLSLFSRAWGLWLGREGRPWSDPAWRGALIARPWVLQCWSRREYLPGAREKRPVLIEVELRERALREELAASPVARMVHPGAVPEEPGTPVLSAIRVRPGDWGWGLHLHTGARVPFAGGEFPWPEREVPSRAYLKCREALWVSETRLTPGETVLELGCAPGGALLALLEHGLEVIGVDPGELAPAVPEFAGKEGRRLVHLKTRAEKLQPEALPPRIDWLFSDMNVAPAAVFNWVDRWLPDLRARGLRGAFLTLKLTDREFVRELQAVVERKRRDWSASRLLLRQLSQNRGEVLLYIAT
ncbi:MAG: hypothetical protein NDJ90_16000 [Oligoflexia bacterium]|nr:hypothetical protein [Oligoflexia bacterium]